MGVRISSANGFGVVLGRAALLTAVWWTLAEGEPSWVFGAPVILLALALSLAIAPTRRPLASRGTCRLRNVFSPESLRSGFDVARRALHPEMPLAPALLDYHFRLPPGPARLFMVNVVSLLPGTLSADLSESGLVVHVLDRSLPMHDQLQVLERYVAALFGMSLPADQELRHD